MLSAITTDYESCIQNQSPDSATLDEFCAFLVQELPPRIAVEVDNHLRVEPARGVIQGDMTEIVRNTIREVMEEFLPSLRLPSVDHGESPGVSSIMLTPSQGSLLIAGQPLTTPSISANSSHIYSPTSQLSPQPVTTSSLVPLFDSAAISSFDFRMDNQHLVLDENISAQFPSSSLNMTPTTWTMNEEFDDICIPCLGFDYPQVLDDTGDSVSHS
jgi:hypothetical protein